MRKYASLTLPLAAFGATLAAWGGAVEQIKRSEH